MGHCRRPGLNLALILLLVIGSILTIAPETKRVHAGPQISLTTPSAEASPTLPEGDDYAKTVLGDPWDMNEITDIRKEQSFNITDLAVADGVLSFKSGLDSSPYTTVKTPTDPSIMLLFPGYVNPDGSPATQNIGKLGANYTIDATKYKVLSFRMFLSSVVSTGPNRSQVQVIWTNGANFVPGAYAAIGVSNGIQAYQGWHTYSVDLSTIGLADGTVIWGDSSTGGTTIRGLRLDPTTDADVTIKIDWVRLTPADNASTTQRISWTRPDDTATAVVNLKVVTDTTAPVYATIRDGLVSSGSSSYDGGTANLPLGRYYVRAEIGTEWAAMIRGDAWDMNEATDVYPDGVGGSNATLSFSGGVMTGVNKDADPYFMLGFSPATPISATVFNKLSIKMTSPKADFFQVFWVREGDSGLDPFNRAIGPFSNPTTRGAGVYTVDLAQNPNWSGNVRYLRIDPMHNASAGAAGESWQVDWVALDTAGVNRTDEPGISTAFSPGVLTINDAPNILVTKPSMATGEDYAESMLAYTWDMDNIESSLDDGTGRGRLVDIGPYDFTDGVLSGVTKGTVTQRKDGAAESDNQIWLNTGVIKGTSETPIDTNKFKYVTWRFWQKGTQNTTEGWISRFIWWIDDVGRDSSVTKDIVIEEGWNTYKLDLSKVLIEPVSAEVPSAYGWRDLMKYFRFDPNEIANAAGTLTSTFHLDYIKLTAPDVAYDSFDIRWTATSGISPTVSLYYDTDTNSSNGMTLITVSIPAATGAYNWDASAVPEGTYYIYAKVQDAYNSTGRYSESPVIVKRSPSVSITQPSGTAPAVPLGADYATKVLGNAWDMADSSDVFKQIGLSGSVANGLYTGTATSEDPQIQLVNFFDPAFPSALDVSKQIDASKYKKLTFRMYVSEPGLYQVMWSAATGPLYATAYAVAMKGWHTYSADLGSQTGWTGSIKYLRLDPTDRLGATLKISWIKLTDPSSSSQQLTWSGTNLGNSTISLYHDTDNSGRGGTLIARGLQGTSYTWDTSALARGTYYIYAKIDDGVGPGVWGSYSSVPVNVAGGILQLPPKVFLPALQRNGTGAW